MLILEYKKKFLDQLKNEYPPEEAGSFFNILAKYFFGWERINLALDPSKEINDREVQIMDMALSRLLSHEPIQYIIGETEFFGNRFKVNSYVLIPRPETEDLVQWISDDLITSEKKSVSILDIGTGSGCIAISLAKIFPDAAVWAMDVSEEALKVAVENSALNGTNVNFILEDVLQLGSLPEKFDIIVSNPPYVRELEKEQMHRNVLEHEPELALYVKDNDPLIFYKKITKLAEEGLNPGGRLYFEINQYLGEQTLEIVKNSGFATELRKDIFGNNRMIRGIKNNGRTSGFSNRTK